MYLAPEARRWGSGTRVRGSRYYWIPVDQASSVRAYYPFCLLVSIVVLAVEDSVAECHCHLLVPGGQEEEGLGECLGMIRWLGTVNHRYECLPSDDSACVNVGDGSITVDDWTGEAGICCSGEDIKWCCSTIESKLQNLN